MEETMITINYLAVLVAAGIEFGLGALWFGPLFGKSWMAAHGWTEEDLQDGNQARNLAFRAVATLVAAFVLAHIIQLLDVTTLAGGLETGFWIWLGFIATFTADHVLFEKGPVKAWIINNAYHLSGMLIMGGILAVWQ